MIGKIATMLCSSRFVIRYLSPRQHNFNRVRIRYYCLVEHPGKEERSDRPVTLSVAIGFIVYGCLRYHHIRITSHRKAFTSGFEV
jgi:hypothetical protein